MNGSIIKDLLWKSVKINSVGEEKPNFNDACGGAAGRMVETSVKKKWFL